jgi:hypothetical protein
MRGGCYQPETQTDHHQSKIMYTIIRFDDPSANVSHSRRQRLACLSLGKRAHLAFHKVPAHQDRLWDLSRRAISGRIAVFEQCVFSLFLAAALLATVTCFSEWARLTRTEALDNFAANSLTTAAGFELANATVPGDLAKR